MKRRVYIRATVKPHKFDLFYIDVCNTNNGMKLRPIKNICQKYNVRNLHKTIPKVDEKTFDYMYEIDRFTFAYTPIYFPKEKEK